METRSTGGQLAKGLAVALSFLMIVLSALDVVCIFSAPWWLKTAYDKGYGELGIFFGTPYNNAHPGGSYPYMLLFITLCGLGMLGILLEGYRILRRIRRGKPFAHNNAASFRRAAVLSFVLAGLFLFKMFFSPSILTLLCIGVFLMFGLFMLVLAQLFGLAAQIREENALTI